MNREIKHSERVKETLVGRGYKQVCVEMLLEGYIAKSGSVHMPEYGEHTIYHDIALKSATGIKFHGSISGLKR